MSGSSWAEELQQLVSDPITYDLMDDAVITPYGHTFSEMSLKRWLNQNPCCPVSNQKLSADMLSPNYAIRDLVKFLKAHPARFESSKETKEKGGLRFGQDAENTRKKMHQSELDCRVSKALLGEYEASLVQIAAKKSENQQKRVILEEQILVYQDQVAKETEYAKHQKEMAEKMGHLEGMEVDLIRSVEAKTTLVADLTNRANEAKKSLLPSFLSREKELAEELSQTQKELRVDQSSLDRLSSQKIDVSDNLVRATRLLEEVAEANHKPKQELQELESQMSFLQGEYSALDSEENQVLFRVNALKVQVKGLEKELVNVRQEIEEYKRIMEAFLQSAEAMEERVREDYPLMLTAVRLKEKGNEKFRLKEYEAALGFYTQAIETRVDPSFYLNRAAAFTCLNRLPLARDDCMAAIEMDISSEQLGKCYRRLATVCIKEKKRIEAMQWATKALGLNQADMLAKDLLESLEKEVSGRR
mmetsp:Transcript_37847/g.59824  ORF Transcript_37847/g.59824 Transcript_37847/m.59824 type:complete len:474 (-) Transcript_37847:139-1560(-)